MNLRLLVGAFALTLPTLASAAGPEWSGFGSAYVAKSHFKHARPTVLNDTNVDVTGLSLMGLNFKAQIEDQLTASAQIIARMNDEDRGYVNAKWFYATWTPMTDLHVKAGRQVYPLFINSENADVHALLPFTRIPDELTMMAPFQSFDGASADHAYRLSPDLTLTVAVQGGRTIFAPGMTEQRYGHDLAGINVGMNGAWWSVALHASRMGFTSSSSQPEDSLANYTVGVKAERWNFLLQAEGLHQDTNKGNGDAGYALLGYKINRWMPRYAYSWARAKSLMAGETMTQNLGVNYQIGQRLVAKLDMQLSKISKQRGGVGVTRDNTDGSALAEMIGLDFLF